MSTERKRRILPEEEYEEVLEEIIGRDFFPDVKRIRRTLEEEEFLTLDESPQAPETQTPAASLTLDRFQATHVTEDDLDFEKILYAEQRQREDQLAWVKTESDRHNLALLAAEAELKQIQDHSQNVHGLLIGGTRMRELRQLGAGMLTNRHVPQNVLMFPPPFEQLDNFGRLLPQLPCAPRPLALVDQADSRPLMLKEGQLAFRNMDAPLATKPEVQHPNTRFTLSEQSAQDMLRLAPIEALENDRERTFKLRDHRQLAADQAMASGRFDQSGLAGLQIERTPVVAPEDVPIMTWGEIGATPIVLRPEEEEFTMQSVNERDALAESLRAKVTGKAREKRRNTMALKDMAATLRQTPLTASSIFGGLSAVRARNTTTTAVLQTPLGQSLAKNLVDRKSS